MRAFYPIDPVIVNLYLHILHLSDMGERLDGYIAQYNDVPSDLQIELQNSATLLVSEEVKALETFGSKEAVDRQLTWFHDRRGQA